jgi:hypothetical protein
MRLDTSQPQPADKLMEFEEEEKSREKEMNEISKIEKNEYERNTRLFII